MRAFIVLGTIVAGLALSPVTTNSQNPASGSLQRASVTDSAKRSGCKVANFQRTPGDIKFVSIEGYLNSTEARVTVKPNNQGTCAYNDFRHIVNLNTTCWNGENFPNDSWEGDERRPVNRARSCAGTRLLGGRGMMFYMVVRGGA
jgi:hypothetical protein